MTEYIEVLKNFSDFSGRARRREYWMFVLVNLIISIALRAVAHFVGIMHVLVPLYGLAVLIPAIAVSVRRLHDTGRSGWWLLISLIPIVGAIVLLVFFVQDSDAGQNQYGFSPK